MLTVLSPLQKKTIYQRFQMGDIPEKDYNNIIGLAKKYARRSFSYIDVDDLIQEGCLAYLKGRDKYDFDKNDYYMGFIYKRVVGAMLDYIASQSHSGSSTVRNVEPKQQFSVTSIDEFSDMYGACFEDALIAELDEESMFSYFKTYVMELTQLERTILIKYFVDKDSMVQIGKDLPVSRLKVKKIITTCVNYIKERYGYDLEEKLNFRVISRVD